MELGEQVSQESLFNLQEEIWHEWNPNESTPYLAAYAHHNGIHMMIRPQNVKGGNPFPIAAYEVIFQGENEKAERDDTKLLYTFIVDGTPDDLEEMAFTYATRLKNGVRPEDMFQDMQEASRKAMQRLLEDYRANKIKKRS